jgi:hypothetical protein
MGPLPTACPMSLAVLILWPCPRTARADTDQSPPPQAPPAQTDIGEPDEAPRRDFRMGTRDNMRMGRKKEGDLIMEVEPRPPKGQTPRPPPFTSTPRSTRAIRAPSRDKARPPARGRRPDRRTPRPDRLRP